MKSMNGRCLCGAVRFVAEENVTFEGAESLARYASSDWAERGFCSQCGSTLFYYLKPAQTFMMSVGAFDDAAAFRLVEEIYIDSKPSGYALAGDHPRLTEAETLAKFGFSS